MSDIRCSNSHVLLVTGEELLCENTVEDIEKQLEDSGSVKLDLSRENTWLTVNKAFIVGYFNAD